MQYLCDIERAQPERSETTLTDTIPSRRMITELQGRATIEQAKEASRLAVNQPVTFGLDQVSWDELQLAEGFQVCWTRWPQSHQDLTRTSAR